MARLVASEVKGVVAKVTLPPRLPARWGEAVTAATAPRSWPPAPQVQLAAVPSGPLQAGSVTVVSAEAGKSVTARRQTARRAPSSRRGRELVGQRWDLALSARPSSARPSASRRQCRARPVLHDWPQSATPPAKRRARQMTPPPPSAERLRIDVRAAGCAPSAPWYRVAEIRHRWKAPGSGH
jgi:hypothetical protein